MSTDDMAPLLPRERRRFLDWRFLVALVLLLLVAGVAWRSIEQSREIADKGHRIDQLIQTLQREQADADEYADAATAERDQLLDNQRAMLARMRSMEGELRTLRHWLAEQGIEVPADFGTAPRADPKASRPGPRAAPPRKRATTTAPRKRATSPAGKPRGQSDDHRPPQAPGPPVTPQPPRLPRIPSLSELLDPIL